ncbi:MAG: DUF1501 domain-containing protein [Gemmataceae bacterium]|nr:DUF1501 domain-containing protein [Gemmataceae bacterium]
MFNLSFGKSKDCESTNRREFLRMGSLGLAGLTLPKLLQAEAASKAASKKVEDRSVIFMWMQGGPSHIDSFDPKPNAPTDIRGEFGVTQTALPGVQICEHLPKLAANLDKFSIVRSGYTYNGSHGVADAYMLTGFRFNPTVVHPTYGAVMSRELGYRKGMPPYVQLGTSIDQRFGGGLPGYAGSEHNPFIIDDDPSRPNFNIDGVSLPSGLTASRFDRRGRMLQKLDNWQKRVETSGNDIGAMNSFYEKAFSMVTSPDAKKAFDINQEPEAMRERYGMNRFGQSCLMARRMVEAGVRFVNVTMGGWDTHAGNFKTLKDRNFPIIDKGWSALLEDLQMRGMLENTLVIWCGDFGRTPKINSAAGRDHWAGSTIFCLGGGGFKTGAVIGKSDKHAEQPATQPIQIEDIAATLYTVLGIPLDKHYVAPDGRPFRINATGKVVNEILA